MIWVDSEDSRGITRQRIPSLRPSFSVSPRPFPAPVAVGQQEGRYFGIVIIQDLVRTKKPHMPAIAQEGQLALRRNGCD